MFNAIWDQDRFAEVQNDAADESATLNTTNQNWTQVADTTFRVRFCIQQTRTSADSALTITPTLYYSYNSGAYTEVGNPTDTDAPIRVAADANVTDGATTTLRLGSGDSNVAGRLEDGAPGAASVTVSNPSTGEATEYEWALELYGDYSGLTNADTIVLRVYDSTTALDTYTNEPTITVSTAQHYTLDATTVVTFSETGQDAALVRGRPMVADAASHSSTVQDATLARGRKMSAGTVSHSLTGTDVTFDLEMVVSSTSYAHTGQDATLTYSAADETLDAQPVAYSTTGTDVTFVRGRPMVASSVSHSLTGTAVTFDHGMTAAPSGFSSTGTDASLVRGRPVVASPVSYSLTGTAATKDVEMVVSGYGYEATFGHVDFIYVTFGGKVSYALTGTAASFVKGVTGSGDLDAAYNFFDNLVFDGTDNWSLGGGDNLVKTWDQGLGGQGSIGFPMAASAISFSHVGQDADLVFDGRLTASGASHALTGADVAFDLEMVVGSGSYTSTVADADLDADRILGSDSVTYSSTGSDVTFDLEMVASSTSHSIVGTDADLNVDRNVTASGSTYALTGVDVTFDFGLTASLVSYSASVQDATFPKGASGTGDLDASASQVNAVGYVGFDVVGGAGSFSVSGADAFFDLEMVVSPVSHSLTGQGADLNADRTVVAGAASRSIVGTDVTFDLEMVALPTARSLTGADAFFDIEMVASPGSYSLTVQDAGLSTDKNVVASSTSFSTTGADAVLRVGRKMPAVGASRTVTGATVALLAAFSMQAAAVSHTVTGIDASSLRGYAVSASPTSLASTGSSVAFDRTVSSQGGAYSISHGDAGLLKGFTFSCGASTSTLSWTDVSFVKGANGTGDLDAGSSGINAVGYVGFDVVAGVASYSLSGSGAGFDLEMVVSSGSYYATGTDVSFDRARKFPAAASTFSTIGSDVGSVFGRTGTGDLDSGPSEVNSVGDVDFDVVASPASFALAGGSTSLTADRVLDGSPSSLSFTHSDADLDGGFVLQASSGAFSAVGQDAALDKGSALQVGTLSLGTTGSAVAFDRTVQSGATSYTVTGSDAGFFLEYEGSGALISGDAGINAVA